MVRKSRAPSYAELTIEPIAAITPEPAEGAPEPEISQLGRAKALTLREAASQYVLYLHPAAAKALKRYAVENNSKVHDILIEAIEDWFRGHGLREPVRAKGGKTAKPRLIDRADSQAAD